jgi:hypothetical protein
LGWER